MEIITMIMCGLALLAAIVSLILIVQEKKRNEKRNAALVNLIRVECVGVGKAVMEHIDEVYRTGAAETNANFRHMKDIVKILETLSPIVNQVVSNSANMMQRVGNLESGIVPDYNEALAAKEAVDSFNMGISGILGFDPMKVAKEMRTGKAPGGGE